MRCTIVLCMLIHDKIFEQKSSWKNLFAYMGPGFLVSIAYIDPGNCKVLSPQPQFTSIFPS